MHPTLLTLGSLNISSFGFFLSLGFLLAIFIVWRLTRVYDIDEERTLDLSLLTFFGGLIGSRIFFVLMNLSQFNSIEKIILFNRFPGLSFWGGLIGGSVTLYLFSRRFKLNFFQIADFVIVGFFAGLILGEFGCLLGGCQYGMFTNLPIGVMQVGLLGKRFPIQLLSALIYLIILLNLWRVALKFHWSGKVLGLGLIFMGLTSFLFDFLRGDRILLTSWVSLNMISAVISLGLGLVTIYRVGKRSIKSDLGMIPLLFTSEKFRQTTLSRIGRGWYNLKVNFRVSLLRYYRLAVSRSKSILKSINVKYQKPQL